MRVLHVLDASAPAISGYSSRSRAIVNAQRAQGLHPVVLTSARHKNRPGVALETIDDIAHYRTLKPLEPRKHLLQESYHLRRRILEVARLERADVIHAHSPILVGGPAWLAARQLGVGCVYEVRSLWEEGHIERGEVTDRSPKYRLTRGVETWLTRRVDAVVCISEGLRSDFIARGIPPERLHVVPNGVDVRRFVPLPPVEATRARLGLQGKTVVGYLGTFFQLEGVVDLVEALARLIKRGRHDVAGLIVGAGATYEACKELAARHGLADRILHPGHVPAEEVEGLYSVMDVLAYPRRRLRVTELVTPLKPLEAMAMEKAVIASDVGGLKELIQDGVTGLLFPSGQVDDLAAAIERLVDDPALRRTLGRQARERVSAERDWRNLIVRYSPVYDAAMRGRRRKGTGAGETRP